MTEPNAPSVENFNNFASLLKDANIRASFAKFNESQASTSTFIAVSALMTMGIITFTFRLSAGLKYGLTGEQKIFAALLMALNVLIFAMLWSISLSKVYRNSKKKIPWLKSIVLTLPTCQMFQVALPIIVATFFGLQLIFRVLAGQCDHGIFWDELMCNPHQNTSGLPEETLTQLFLLPIVFHVILRDTRVVSYMISWAISVGSLICVQVLLATKILLITIILYVVFSAIILYDNQRQNLALFFLGEKLKHSLAENERLADETHASELRHMIANVAHDLKTVSMMFIYIYCFWLRTLADSMVFLLTFYSIDLHTAPYFFPQWHRVHFPDCGGLG